MPRANEVPGSQARLLRKMAPCLLICCSSNQGSRCRAGTPEHAVHAAGIGGVVIGGNREGYLAD